MQQTESRVSFAKENATKYKSIQQTDYITRNKILNRTLEFLLNPRIRNRQTGVVFQCILHKKTKAALMRQGFSIEDITKLKNEVFDFVEHDANDYEIVRDMPSSLYYDLKRTGETDLTFTKRAAPIPNFILNALICEALEKEFSRDLILSCEGFILREECIRLDIDEKYARRGFLTPIIQNGLIVGFNLFRHPDDNRPFVLRSRKNFDVSGRAK